MQSKSPKKSQNISAHSLQLIEIPKGKLLAIFHVGESFVCEAISFIAVDVLPGTKAARTWYFFLGDGGIQHVCDPHNVAWVGENRYPYFHFDVNKCRCRSCSEKKAGTVQ
jgi:hypothetical protein